MMHYDDNRFRVACCGRRWGKSLWAGHEITVRMFIPDSMNWICGPNYKLGEKEFRVVFNDFKTLGLLDRCAKQYNVNQGHMRIYFKDLNSTLEVVSAEKQDSLVGEGLDSVCMSEAAKHKLSTWQMYIEPALSDKRGCADFPSTPQGFNWFKGLFDLGQTDEPEYQSWHAPTWTNAAMFPGGFNDSEMTRIRNKVTQAYWRQEYGAEFTAFEGMIYPEFNIAKHVRKFNYNPFWKNWWTFDFGFVDPFVCYDIMIDPSDRIWVWREYQVRGKNTYDHCLALKHRPNPEGWHVDSMAADPRGADEISIIQMMLGSVLANSVGWSLGVEAIGRALKIRDDGLPGLIIHPSCTELVRQLQILHHRETREGHNAKPGQHDYDDHGPDALRYFFNEYVVLGGAGNLADVYAGYGKSEAAGFFRYATQGFKFDEPGRW